MYNEMAGEDGVLTAEDWASTKQSTMDAKIVVNDYGPTRFLPTPLSERLLQTSPFPARPADELTMHSCVRFRAGLDVTAKPLPLPGRSVETEIGKDRRTLEEIGWRNMPAKPWRDRTLRHDLMPRYPEECQSTVDGGSEVPTPRVSKQVNRESKQRGRGGRSLSNMNSGRSRTLTDSSRLRSQSGSTLTSAKSPKSAPKP